MAREGDLFGSFFWHNGWRYCVLSDGLYVESPEIFWDDEPRWFLVTNFPRR